MAIYPGELKYPLPDLVGNTPFYNSMLLSWTAYGGGYFYPSYRQDAAGYVALYGACKGGSNGTVFTMPAGLRPLNKQAFPVTCGTGYQTGYLTIDGSGTMTLNVPSGANTWVTLDGITWKGEQ